MGLKIGDVISLNLKTIKKVENKRENTSEAINEFLLTRSESIRGLYHELEKQVLNFGSDISFSWISSNNTVNFYKEYEGKVKFLEVAPQIENIKIHIKLGDKADYLINQFVPSTDCDISKVTPISRGKDKGKLPWGNLNTVLFLIPSDISKIENLLGEKELPSSPLGVIYQAYLIN